MEEKSKIEKYIEYVKTDNRSRINKELFPEERIVFKTEIDEKIKTEIPEKMVFKPNLLNKILISIFGCVGFLIFGIVSHQFIPFYIFSIISIGLFLKVWFMDPNNILILDTKGITLNEDTYDWENIISTHISYIERPSNNGEDESYLILELKNGQIRNLEITKINFSNIFISSSISNEYKLAHYIEKFKQKTNVC
jgi:hypothetical protein